MDDTKHPTAADVRGLFSTVARRYDLLNDVMSAGLHRRWKRRLVELAGRPERALDLCCGSGDLAQALEAKVVVGADFTPEMLRVAASRRTSRAPAWLQADALCLPFPDDTFDVVTCGYGLRNLASLTAGLKEILRVLRPGGRLLALDFGKPANATWRRLYFWQLRHVVPAVGVLFGGEKSAYEYILPSLERYPGQRGVRERMEDCGFVECGYEEYVGGAMSLSFGAKRSG